MTTNRQDIPLNMVGSNIFGRYPKISSEQTWNMFISDNWLAPYFGHQAVYSSSSGFEGRALFNSTRAKTMIMVVDDNVYAVDSNLAKNKIGELESFSGDVFIDENDANQIGICDKKDIHVYNHETKVFSKAPITGFIPGYIAFQDGYFIAPDLSKPEWRLSALNNGLSWPSAPANIGRFEGKADDPVACIRIPAKENQLMVIGGINSQFWTNVGYRIFPYQRNTGFSVDYGAIPDTIASSDTFVIWAGVNEKSGLTIMVSSGGGAEQISTDGINYRLSQLSHPEMAYGFLVKLDGHLFYQITFPHVEDNLSYIYDLNTKKFFSLSDEDMNCHIAKQAIYFNGDYYFISFKDGNLYKMSSSFSTYNGKTIPRIRIPSTIRKADNSPFIINKLSFVTEQGQGENRQHVSPAAIKGEISLATDFPIKENVKYGDAYLIPNGITVVDDDDIRTYTCQTFSAPLSVHLDKLMIIWNGFNWDVVGDNTMNIDLSVSYDGGNSFGNVNRIDMNREGVHQNMVVVWGLGHANEFVPQFRFLGKNRFLVGNGTVSVY